MALNGLRLRKGSAILYSVRNFTASDILQSANALPSCYRVSYSQTTDSPLSTQAVSPHIIVHIHISNVQYFLK
jgi:hypothetical protein